ncbi:MAG TPA: TonB-dependent receptor [Pyrinomonadaceae bacterium]|nr:TonB-dependent receptor [Pyrinomonadaceae bacterium]
MRTFSILILISSLLLGSAPSPQVGITLKGSVQDQAGSVIPEAKLILTNTITAEVRTVVADNAGCFSFADVQPGQYSLKAKADGFEEATTLVTVADQPLEWITLKLGINLKEEVTITDTREDQVISSQNNADAIDLDSDFLKALPAQSDDILPIIGNFLSTSAQGTEGLSVVVDGAEGSQLNLPTDAIRRVIINRNPYSSAFRRPGEGRVEVITKDGSRRRYDGTFSYMVRNSIYDARDTFTRRLGLSNPKLDRRLFSASFGGPVPKLKNATFFFSANHLINNQDVGINAITVDGPLIDNVLTTKKRLKVLARFDLRLNEVHTLSGRYYYYNSDETGNGLGAQFVLPSQGFASKTRGDRFMFSDRAILSPNLLNDLTINFSRETYQEGQTPDKPALLVRGAFVGGPSQTDRTGSEKLIDVQDAVTYTHGNHNFRFGGGLRARFINSIDRTNFVGTYKFQGLPEFLEVRPASFELMQGDPASSGSQYEAYGFFEDEIRLRPWLSVTAGLRYDFLSTLKDFQNFGPRVSFAFAPGNQKTVLRGGAGIFYERLSFSVVQAGDRKTVEIVNPSYPNPFSNAARRRTPLPDLFGLAPDLAAPYMVMGSVSLERMLWKRSKISVEYHKMHGVHLLRAHDINAPLDQFGPEFIGVRPNMSFRKITQVESSASSRSSALKFTFQGRIGKVFKGTAQYTYSRTTDDTAGPLVPPENNYDFSAELGRSNFDQRHRFTYVSTIDMPFAFRLGAVLSITSGFPYDITTGFDDNGDRTYRDRPLGGTRNTGQAPPVQQLDLRLTKLFKFPTPFKHKAGASDRRLRNLEISFDVFNVFNHPNTPIIVGELGAHYFGQATTTNMARTLQLSVKYNF